MGARRKCPQELRDRATRMVMDTRKDPDTRAGAYRGIDEPRGSIPRRCGWQKEEVNGGVRLGHHRADAARLGEPKRENASFAQGAQDQPASCGDGPAGRLG